MEATAVVNWDVTFMIHGATGIGDYYPLSDKTDPFAGIFVDGRQVGLTTTRWNDYTPIWQTRMSFNVDQEGTSMICLAVFDRDTVDGSDAGATLDEMSTKNALIDVKCMNVIAWGGGDETWKCYTDSCPSVTLTDQPVKLSDDTDVKVTYDIEITTSHPPPPSPSPPPPLVSRTASSPSFKRVEYKSSSDSEEGMPTITKVLLGIVGIFLLPCLRCFYRSVCKERQLENGTPPSRSQTDPNAITVEMESASPSASVRQTAGDQSNGVPPASFVTMWPASGVEPGATDKSNGAPQRYGRELPVPPPPQQQQARNLNKATALREARKEARQRAGEPVVVQGEPVVVHGETVVERPAPPLSG